MLTLADIEAARERIAGGVYLSPCVESIPLSRAHRRAHLLQARLPAAHRQLQGARRAQCAAEAFARRAPPRRHRRLGRQPRAGRRLSRRAAGHPGDRGDAAVRGAGQGDQLPGARGRRGAAWRRSRRSAHPRRSARAPRRSHVRASVRQRRRHRRPGHDGARNPGTDAGSRRDRGSGRRRRAARRHRHRRQGHAAADARHRRRARPRRMPQRRAGRRASGAGAAVTDAGRRAGRADAGRAAVSQR